MHACLKFVVFKKTLSGTQTLASSECFGKFMTFRLFVNE